MDKQKIKTEIAHLLQDPDRDFEEFPITTEESQELVITLFELVGDPMTSEESADFYLTCLMIVKSHMTYQ